MENCYDCKNKNTKLCNICTSNTLISGTPTHWEPIVIDASKIDENATQSYRKHKDLDKPNYWDNICKIQQKQTRKGINKYGDILENNPTKLDIIERITYLQEEMIDGLMYCEHIKKYLEDTLCK